MAERGSDLQWTNENDLYLESINMRQEERRVSFSDVDTPPLKLCRRREGEFISTKHLRVD